MGKEFHSHDTWGIPVTPPEPGKRQTVAAYLRSRFATGALVAFPLVVTLFFGRFLFNLLDRWSYPISNQIFGRYVPGLGAALAILLILLLGVLAHRVFGRRMLGFGDKAIGRVPVLGAIYLGAREVTKAFAGDRTKNFRRVVLVPFPHSQAYVVAFLTAEFYIQGDDGPQRMNAVFLPTTPNPTTGFFLMYPVEVVRPCHLTVEEAVRMVISGGLLAPEPERIFGAGPTRTDAVR